MPTHYALPRNHACRLDVNWTLNGIRAVVLENELLRITILSGKGGDVYEFLHKPTDTDFMWKTARGLPPAERLTNGPNPLAPFVEYYFGGWQELFPHGSSPADYMGTTMYQHGEATALPFDVTVKEDTEDAVAVTLSARMRQTPLLLEKTYRLTRNDPTLIIEETATNLGATDLDIMWGHHPAFSSHFLNADCRVFAPIEEMKRSPDDAPQTTWPIWKTPNGKELDYSVAPYPGGDVRTGNMIYGTKLSGGWYALLDTKKKLGFGMTWDADMFPYIWIWRGYRHANSGFPNYGYNEHTIAIEPFTSMPQAHEKDRRLLPIPGGNSVSTTFRAQVISGVSRVTSIARDGSINE